MYRCDTCQRQRYAYHSCANRHCPKCQGKATKRWMEARQKQILPCAYFLYTFTLPKQLRQTVRMHPNEMYAALITQAAASLKKLALDPRYLGAELGMIAVLHTWDQKLNFHPHVHFLIPGGGVDENGTWIGTRYAEFLVPIAALRVIFRAKMRDAMKRMGLAEDIDPAVWKRPWVVHGQHAGRGKTVLRYLARYVHRVAITSSRIESHQSDRVVFRFWDRKKKRTTRCKLRAQEFVRRFLQHVLPPGFHKVRYFGILSPCWTKRLAVRGFTGWPRLRHDRRKPGRMRKPRTSCRHAIEMPLLPGGATPLRKTTSKTQKGATLVLIFFYSKPRQNIRHAFLLHVAWGEVRRILRKSFPNQLLHPERMPVKPVKSTTKVGPTLPSSSANPSCMPATADKTTKDR